MRQSYTVYGSAKAGPLGGDGIVSLYASDNNGLPMGKPIASTKSAQGSGYFELSIPSTIVTGQPVILVNEGGEYLSVSDDTMHSQPEMIAIIPSINVNQANFVTLSLFSTLTQNMTAYMRLYKQISYPTDVKFPTVINTAQAFVRCVLGFYMGNSTSAYTLEMDWCHPHTEGGMLSM